MIQQSNVLLQRPWEITVHNMIFFVIHSKCWWEGNPSKESVQECMTFITTLMNFITQWHDKYNEKQNDKELSEDLRYYSEQLSTIDKKVINDRIKALTYY